MAQALPHVFGGMRSKHRQRQRHYPGRFAHSRIPGASTLVNRLAGVIHQLHGARHCHIEFEAFDEAWHIGKEAVDMFAKGGIPIAKFDSWLGCHLARESPGAGQELLGPHGGHVPPINVILWRTSKRHGQAHCVHPIGIEFFGEINHIALGFTHLGAIEDDHSLIK